MKLYDMANYIRNMVNVIIGIVLVIALFIYVSPFISSVINQTQQATQKEVIPYTLQPINFSQDPTLNYNIDNTQILYIGNADAQWKMLETKKAKVYSYNFSKNLDIDYLPTAKKIALNLGYDDLNITDNGEISNKYVWAKNGLQLEINKVNKKMTQFPQSSSLANIKKYVTAGNFISNEVANGFGKAFLNSSGRFNREETELLSFEPTFLRFESDFLVETNNISSELCYLKVSRSIDKIKVVSKRYDFPQIYFYISSLRPDIENSYKNYRYPYLKLNKTDYSQAYEGYQFELNNLNSVVETQLKSKNFVISEIKINNSYFGFIPNKDTTNIKTISIESFELGYYDNFDETSLNSNVQPVYVFKGSIELASGEKGKITLYTPALDPKYYSAAK